MPGKVAVDLKDVQETLLLPLWGRAVETQKAKPLLIDKLAVEMVNRMDYDFSTIAKNISTISQFGWVMRSLLLDDIIRGFMDQHPQATIVNIGCGFDTTFERVDNGHITWYDLDLPDVIALRRQFIEESPRRKFIAASFFEPEWLARLNPQDNILFIAAGVLYYFTEDRIKDFFLRLADAFPGGEIAFDATSPRGMKTANQMVVKNSGMDETARLQWGLKSAQELLAWDSRIRLLDERVFFKNTRQHLDGKNRIVAWFSDTLKFQYLVHLQL